MTLAAGTRLGPYEVTAQIGAGGMGEVYRARDTKLDRDVAIKVLPNVVAQDADRLARFRQEARVLASLNHPNIAQIHGLEDSEGTYALIMELVEGPTLADRIAPGPIPVDEALPIARQIAEALEAAHEQGIIHRDLKPANVKVREDGTVKVLDFGLAKALEPVGTTASTGASMSPTITSPAMTEMGMILGTAAYMAPEQARGRPVDRRADIWAFGCVLYEMLTGRRAFTGDEITDILADIVRSEPRWEYLPDGVHPAVRTLLRRCLEKDVRRRKQSIADVRVELETLADTQIPSDAVEVTGAPQRWTHQGLAMVTLAIVLAASGAILLIRGAQPSHAPAMRFPIALSASEQPGDSGSSAVSISPDGQSIVITGKDRLYLRKTGDFETSPVPGTEGAEGAFFSPDGRWIGFFANGRVHKVLLDGGFPQAIGRVPGFPSGASWAPTDIIVIGAVLEGLVTIATEAGSVVSPLTTDGTAFKDERHLSPQVLPGGRHAVFVQDKGGISHVAVASLETGAYWPLFPGGAPHFVKETGDLVYEDGGNLMAVPFDPDSLETTGDPRLVQDGIYSFRWVGSNVSHYAISDEGTLAYLPGGKVPFYQDTRLVWVDRDGAARPFGDDVNFHYYPRLNVSRRQLAVSRQDESGRNIYLYSLDRPVPERFTFENSSYVSAWLPSGARLIHQGMFSQPLDSVAADPLPAETNVGGWPGSVSPDGRYLAYTDVRPESAGDIWILDLENPGEPTPFADGPDNQRSPWFAPDGRAIAYVASAASGDMDVYVAPFPGPGRPVQVTTGGGTEPVWGPGGELFYWQGSRFFSVQVETTPNLRVATTAKALFEDASFMRTLQRMPNYDVSADGTEFIMVQRIGEPRGDQLNIVLNWVQERLER